MAEVSETILGQVLTAALGQNPARQAHIIAGLPQEAAAWGLNQVCGSGLRAVALGAQHIQLGDASIICAGGQERAHARILIGADGGKELFIQRIHISGFGLRIGAGGQQQQRANA